MIAIVRPTVVAPAATWTLSSRVWCLYVVRRMLVASAAVWRAGEAWAGSCIVQTCVRV